MKTLPEIARLLIVECAKEFPSLTEVEILCQTSFQEIFNPPEKMRSVFPNTDSLSLESTRATFLAYNWIVDNSDLDPVRVWFSKIFPYHDQQQKEICLLIKTLEILHEIQFSRDPRYINCLKHTQLEMMDRTRDQLPAP